MGQKPRKLTQQEELVTAFSRSTITAAATFHPQLWSDGKEPADMVIVIGRALLLFNMTASKNYFENLSSHNVVQARDRINQWRGGKQLRGKNQWRSFAIGYDDVDYIAVISVVEGPHAAAQFHDLADWDLPEKVRVCFTLTTKALSRFADLGGGARDILSLAHDLRGKGIVSEAACQDMITDRFRIAVEMKDALITQRPVRFSHMRKAGQKVPFFEYVLHLMFMPRQQEAGVLADFADLDWNDLSSAAAFATVNLAWMENKPTGSLVFKEIGEASKFGLIISTNMQGARAFLADNQDRLSQLSFYMLLNLMPGHISPMIMKNPEIRSQNTEHLLASM